MDKSYLHSLVLSLKDEDLIYLAQIVRDRLGVRVEVEEDRLEQENDERELAEFA